MVFCREVFEEIRIRLIPDKLSRIHTEKRYSRFSYGELNYFVYPFKKRDIDDYNRREILTVDWFPLTVDKNLRPPISTLLNRLTMVKSKVGN